jgi:hypothetical protein
LRADPAGCQYRKRGALDDRADELHVGSLQRAVTLDRSAEKARHPARHASRDGVLEIEPTFCPATRAHDVVSHIECDDQSLTQRGYELVEERPCSRADHDAARPGPDERLRIGDRPHTAGSLNRSGGRSVHERGHDNRADQTRSRTVEVDDMNPARAGGCETGRELGGLAVLGHAGVVPALEADSFPAEQVDRGDYLHC